jgi:hypothetical protein
LGRNTIRSHFVSLDVIAGIKRLYPEKLNTFYELEIDGNQLDILDYYSLMRHEARDEESVRLIEGAYHEGLRRTGVTHEAMSSMPGLVEVLDQVISRLTDYKDQTNLLDWCKLHRKRLDA